MNTERSDSSNPDKVAARRESDRDYRMFLDAAPVGIAVIDQAGPVMMNQAAREILGQQPPDAPESGGKPDSFVLVQAGSGDLYPLQSLPLMRALLHGESTSARDLIVVRPDGELPVESWAKPILDREGNVRYAVAIVTDISERLEQERQLADAHVEVARANEELRDFSLLAAHDLAAPLRTIRGFAELLETEHGADLDADGERILHHICEEATRMQRLVESLVELSRADSASRAVARVDLDATVRGAVKTHQNEIDRVAAEIDIAPLPVVLGDKRQIAQVFENLVDNALKYRRAHVPLLVWVSATTQGDKIEIRVADNGRGVPPGEAAKIFVPLHQGTGAPPGHGLGLSICRRIVERHGGRMWAEPNGDAESNGSCFCITLPLADPEPSQP